MCSARYVWFDTARNQNFEHVYGGWGLGRLKNAVVLFATSLKIYFKHQTPRSVGHFTGDYPVTILKALSGRERRPFKNMPVLSFAHAYRGMWSANALSRSVTR